MKLTLLLWVLLASSIAISQNAKRTSLGMSGSTHKLQDKYVSASVGQQSVTGTFTNESTTIIQGFQQPLLQVVALPNAQQSLKAVVFPNPMDALLNIQFQEQINEVVSFSIFSITGQLVKTQTNKGIRKTTLSVADLASGNYVLAIEANGQTFTTKLIKN